MSGALRSFEFYDFYDQEDQADVRPSTIIQDFFLDVGISFDAEAISSPLPSAYTVYNDEAPTELIENMSIQPSAARVFWTQTFPVIGAILGAAWLLFTRLDDSISDTRKEALASVQLLSAETSKRFDGFEVKLDGTNTKLDLKSSEILKQLTELRIRQVESEKK